MKTKGSILTAIRRAVSFEFQYRGDCYRVTFQETDKGEFELSGHYFVFDLDHWVRMENPIIIKATKPTLPTARKYLFQIVNKKVA